MQKATWPGGDFSWAEHADADSTQQQQQKSTFPWTLQDAERDGMGQQLQQQQQPPVASMASGASVNAAAAVDADLDFKGVDGEQDTAAKAAYREWSGSFEARMVSTAQLVLQCALLVKSCCIVADTYHVCPGFKQLAFKVLTGVCTFS